MPKHTLGVICGIVYGLFSVATMIPLEFPDKKAAMLGAFINRFSIGFVIGITTVPIEKSVFLSFHTLTVI